MKSSTAILAALLLGPQPMGPNGRKKSVEEITGYKPVEHAPRTDAMVEKSEPYKGPKTSKTRKQRKQMRMKQRKQMWSVK